MTDPNGVLRERVATNRARRAGQCVDVVSITRVTRGALNTTTSVYATTSAPIYTGAARVKRESRISSDQLAGDGERQAARILLVLPYGATGGLDLRAGDLVGVTSSLDSALTGKTLTVVGPEHGTTISGHVYTVEEVSA